MIHIAPWRAAVGLIKGAARLLPANGTLFLYGPYLRAGVATALAHPYALPLGVAAQAP